MERGWCVEARSSTRSGAIRLFCSSNPRNPWSVVWGATRTFFAHQMIRKLKSGEYRLYSRKKDPKTGKRRNLGTFKTRAAAEKHEKAVQFFKRRG